jgi:hypothetical protein
MSDGDAVLPVTFPLNVFAAIVAKRELASDPANPAVIEAACKSDVAGVPPSVNVMLVSLLAVSAAGVTPVEIAVQAKPLPLT